MVYVCSPEETRISLSPDIDALSIRNVFRVIRLRGAVSLNVENGKADFVAVSESVFIGDREVAVNPVPDLNPLADNPLSSL